MCKSFALALAIVVMSVEYRLLLEHRYSAPPYDRIVALRYLMRNAQCTLLKHRPLAHRQRRFALWFLLYILLTRWLKIIEHCICEFTCMNLGDDLRITVFSHIVLLYSSNVDLVSDSAGGQLAAALDPQAPWIASEATWGEDGERGRSLRKKSLCLRFACRCSFTRRSSSSTWRPLQIKSTGTPCRGTETCVASCHYSSARPTAWQLPVGRDLRKQLNHTRHAWTSRE